jgi:methionyl-tRNA synthetase
MQIHRGLEQLVSLVQLANQFFQLQKPWKMDNKRERERINSVLFLAYETVRLSAIFLQPVTPQLSHKMLAMYVTYFYNS